MTRSIRLGIPALLLLAAGVGCSNKSGIAPCKVEGTLTYKGKPIPAGSMIFFTEDGTTYPASISTDGTYIASDLPAGEYVIVVETDSVTKDAGEGSTGKDAGRYRKQLGQGQQPPAGMGGAPPKQEVYVKIPSKYGKKATSPLTATLKSGRNVHPVELTD